MNNEYLDDLKADAEAKLAEVKEDAYTKWDAIKVAVRDFGWYIVGVVSAVIGAIGYML